MAFASFTASSDWVEVATTATTSTVEFSLSVSASTNSASIEINGLESSMWDLFFPPEPIDWDEVFDKVRLAEYRKDKLRCTKPVNNHSRNIVNNFVAHRNIPMKRDWRGKQVR